MRSFAVVAALTVTASAFVRNPSLPPAYGKARLCMTAAECSAVEPEVCRNQAQPPSLNRRQALQAAGAAVAATGLSFSRVATKAAYADGSYKLPDLPYDYDALEPYIDAATMKFHHDKHHATYVANLNKAMDGKSAPSITDLQKEALKTGGPMRNSGGGHYNHAFFWTTLAPADKTGAPSPALNKAITDAFGSMDSMKGEFAAAATGVFGSGWAWLGVTADGKLGITSTPNQDNPLMDGASGKPMKPILGLDVWEHAYYLKYQNRRPEYVASFWSVVNWPKVSEYFENYASKGLAVPVQG